MPWAAFPLPPHDPALDRIAAILDRVLVPLSFAPAQLGSSGSRAQVIYCRGLVDSLDGGCVDLVLDLEAAPSWRITGVRYDGFPSGSMHLAVPAAPDLDGQLEELAGTLAAQLA